MTMKTIKMIYLKIKEKAKSIYTVSDLKNEDIMSKGLEITITSFLIGVFMLVIAGIMI